MQCACWESCPDDAEPGSDLCEECQRGWCPGGQGEDYDD